MTTRINSPQDVVETMSRHRGTPAAAKPAEPPLTPLQQARRATTPDDLPDGPERIVFAHSETTRAVWHAARARMGSPWAALGVVMADTIAATGPHVQLPPLVGGPGSLNTLVGLVGDPGGGKGTAENIAHHLFSVVDDHNDPIDVPEMPLGSGEGIAELFTRRGTKADEPAKATPDRVKFRIPEIDALTAASSKRESTILPVLRQAFMSEPLGHTGASRDTTRNVPAHSYRMAVVMGIQPRRAGGLLHDADGGTPQRVLWLPVAYPEAPDHAPAAPAPFIIRLPAGTRGSADYGNSPVTMSLPDSVTELVKANRLRRLRGEAVEGLDGHLLFTTEKVAAALALMDGRTNVTNADWDAATAVIEKSTATRELCRDACKGAEVEDRVNRRTVDAEAEDQAAEATNHALSKTVRKKVLHMLEQTGGTPLTYRELNRSMNGNKSRSDGRSQRDRLDDVLKALIGDGLIQDRNAGSDEAPEMEYRLSPQ
ncbi:hypothetical protein [Corynebacterium glyciniphilum]|uniref:hypothetical protein n=1 Tax=Corynebacterium glyciniphilum TaxID=1404244 RepID=UPI0011AB711D|nr:hypothetical protein [Corynebacterium glyciniphilum]